MTNMKRRTGKVSAITGRGMRVSSVSASSDLIDSDTLVGFEAEVENYACLMRIEGNHGWSAKPDGSLRAGIEFVFDAPRKGLQVEQSIEYITSSDVLVHASSPRAGTHIHIDWLDVEESESLYRLAVIAAVIEPGIYAYAGPDRINNTFLVPLAKNDLRVLAEALGDNDEGSFQNWAVNGSRYRGTNFTALRRFGSVEFRYFPAITSYAEVMTWINLCLMLKRAAVARTVDLSAVELAEMLSNPVFIRDFITNNFSEFGISQVLLANIDLNSAAKVARILSVAGRTDRPTIPAFWGRSAAAKRFIDNERNPQGAVDVPAEVLDDVFSDLDAIIEETRFGLRDMGLVYQSAVDNGASETTVFLNLPTTPTQRGTP